MEYAKSLKTITHATSYLAYLNENAAVDLNKMAAAINEPVSVVVNDLAEIAGLNIEYTVAYLTAALEEYLGKSKNTKAILVGVGNLGSAILGYPGFADYSIQIVGAFDINGAVIGKEINGIKVQPSAIMADYASHVGAEIGIIAVNDAGAQTACDKLLAAGVKAIWNFAPVTLNVPDNILIKNENMTALFAETLGAKSDPELSGKLNAAIAALNSIGGAASLKLASEIEKYIAAQEKITAVLIGAGKLGHAFLANGGFEDYGVEVIAAFDKNPDLAGTEVHGVTVKHSSETVEYLKHNEADVGIIAASPAGAQNACDDLVNGGVKLIWNFAPVDLKVPEDVYLKTENIADSLLVLAAHIRKAQ